MTVRAEVAKNKKAREIPLDDEMLATIGRLQGEAKDRQPVKGWTAKQTDQQANSFSRGQLFVSQANTPLANVC